MARFHCVSSPPPNPAGFSDFNICALEGSTSGLVFNLKSRKVKDFQIEVKIYQTHVGIFKNTHRNNTNKKKPIIPAPQELTGQVTHLMAIASSKRQPPWECNKICLQYPPV